MNITNERSEIIDVDNFNMKNLETIMNQRKPSPTKVYSKIMAHQPQKLYSRHNNIRYTYRTVHIRWIGMIDDPIHRRFVMERSNYY